MPTHPLSFEQDTSFPHDFDVSDIFIGREQQLDQFRFYFERWKRFATGALTTSSKMPPSPNEKIQGLVVLLHGRGGFGKSTLLKRYREMTLEYDQDITVSEIVDWEFAAPEKRALFNLALGEKIDEYQYFRLLCDQLALALGKDPVEFKEYQIAIKAVDEAKKQAGSVLDTLERDNRFTWMRSFTREGLLSLICSLPGLGGVSVALSDNELAEKIREKIDANIESGMNKLLQIRRLLQDKLGNKISNYLEPAWQLGQGIGSDLAQMAVRHRLLMFFDTYEEIDEGDRLLQMVMGAAGERVGWVIAGRDNLWAGSSHRRRHLEIEYGYKDLVKADRRMEVDFSADGVGDFTLSDIEEYFALLRQRVRISSLPALTEKDAAHVLEVTSGVPLAIKIVAGLYLEKQDIRQVTEGLDEKRQIVDQMVERYLLHTRTHPADRAKLYGLALLRRAEEPAAIAAAVNVSHGYDAELSRLHRRYGFIFTKQEKPALHQEVRYFLRYWLLQHRSEPEIVTIIQRLTTLHQELFQALETRRQYASLQERLEDEQWVGTYLDLTEQQFWLDPGKGLGYLLPFMLAASIYRREANREARMLGRFFQDVISQPYHRYWEWADQCLVYLNSRNPLQEEFAGLKDLVRLASQRRIAFALPLPPFQEELEAAIWWRLAEAHRGENLYEAVYWYDRAWERLPNVEELREDRTDALWDKDHAHSGARPSLEEASSQTNATVDQQTLDELDRILEENPQAVSSYVQRGRAYAALRQYHHAIADFDHALELEPQQASVLVQRGSAYMALNEHQRAIADFDHALELEPRQASTLVQRGSAYMARGEYRRAITDFDQALELDPKRVSTLVQRGSAYIALGDHQHAITNFDHALEFDPNRVSTLVQRGSAYMVLNEHQRAIADFDRVLRLDTTNVLAYTKRGNVYLHLKEYKRASEDFERALALDPDNEWLQAKRDEATQRVFNPQAFINPDEPSKSPPAPVSRRRAITAIVLGLGVVIGIPAAGVGVFMTQRLFSPAPAKKAPLPQSLPYSYRGHAGTVLSIAWASDGKRAASGSLDKTVQVWDADTGETLVIYKGHSSAVRSVAWSPDGTRLASACDDQTVQVWDASVGKTLFTYFGHSSAVRSVAWSPDGTRLASASNDRTAQIWDANTGKTYVTYTGHISYVSSIAWSPEGKLLASASEDLTVHIWDASTASRALVTYTGHTSSVYSVAWAPDGRRLASASDDTTVRVWEPIWEGGVGKTLFAYSGHTSTVRGVAWAPDGKHLASASDDRSLHVWDAKIGEARFTYTDYQSAVQSVAWDPDSKRLASAGDNHNDQQVRVQDGTKGSFFIYTDHRGPVRSVAWSPDGKQLTSVGDDQTVRIWSIPKGSLSIYRDHTSPVRCVVWSPNGKQLASAGDDRTVRIWDTSGSKTSLFTDTDYTSPVYSVAWSPDGKWLASGSGDWAVFIEEVSSRKRLHTLNGHTGPVYSVAWSPNSKRLASASDDYTVRIWDAETAEMLLAYKDHTDSVQSVAWALDGRRLASAGSDRGVHVWDADTGKTLIVYEGHAKPVRCVAWSPDGTRLASACDDRTVHIWDATTRETLFTYSEHTGSVYGIAWSPDGKWIASASDDRTVRVWYTFQD